MKYWNICWDSKTIWFVLFSCDSSPIYVDHFRPPCACTLAAWWRARWTVGPRWARTGRVSRLGGCQVGTTSKASRLLAASSKSFQVTARQFQGSLSCPTLDNYVCHARKPQTGCSLLDESVTTCRQSPKSDAKNSTTTTKCRVKIRLNNNPSGAASRAWECLYVVRSLGHVVGHGSQCYKLLMRRSLITFIRL